MIPAVDVIDEAGIHLMTDVAELLKHAYCRHSINKPQPRADNKRGFELVTTESIPRLAIEAIHSC